MLIDSLVVGGLRAYPPEPTTVRLAPLTLMFGPNSAGKSTLLSCVPMFQQTAARPNALTMSGDLVEGGTFRMAVHRHDASLPVTIGAGWTGRDGSRREIAAEFVWDPQRRVAVRRRTYGLIGPDRVDLSGPMPWTGQPGAEAATALRTDIYDRLERAYFVGPMRSRAERTTFVGQAGDDYIGPSGEAMTAILHARPDLVEEVNDWCGRLGLGYRVRMLDPVSQDIVVTAGEFAVLALLDVRQEPPVLVSSRAVGYGIGQLLPIIVQSLVARDALIVVEQPEVHLHPRLQSATGDLLIDTVATGRAQLLVETHSEHLVLRLLRRVREGVLDPEDLAILYVDLDADGCAFVRRLEVDERGDLVDGWPGGFFDERLAEVLPTLGSGSR